MSQPVTLFDALNFCNFHNPPVLFQGGRQLTAGEMFGPEVIARLADVYEHPAWGAIQVWSRDKFGHPPGSDDLKHLANEIMASRGVRYEAALLMTLDEVRAFLRPEPKSADTPADPLAATAGVPTGDLCAADIARKIGQPKDRVRNFLARYRKDHADCFFLAKEPRKGKPEYVYYLEEVWPALKEKLAEWRTLE